jgi:hypothetical protein
VDEAEVIREAARSAGLDPKKTKDVLDLMDQVRAKDARKRAKSGSRVPPGQAPTGLLAGWRRQRG